jgi:4-carboxymuconolactone decarboxylase
MIAGLPVSFADAREDVIYQVASALVQPRPVSLGLFRKAKGLIGYAGLVDVAVLIGWFTMVSMTLAGFDVPANADSSALDQ